MSSSIDKVINGFDSIPNPHEYCSQFFQPHPPSHLFASVPPSFSWKDYRPQTFNISREKSDSFYPGLFDQHRYSYPVIASRDSKVRKARALSTKPPAVLPMSTRVESLAVDNVKKFHRDHMFLSRSRGLYKKDDLRGKFDPKEFGLRDDKDIFGDCFSSCSSSTKTSKLP